MSTIVLTYGTFDLFHIGHVRLLERLAGLGDRLYVGCSTDEFNKAKGKRAIFSYEERRDILMSTRFVADVFPETHWGQKRPDILRLGATIFAMGDDWQGKFDDLADLCDVVYLPRTLGVSTTEVRRTVQSLRLAS
jgi:glycerol-3-phosphate cytidylyltransferase